MNALRKKSDQDVVDGLRRTERYRRPAGLAFIVLGIALVGLHIWGQAWMKRKALQIVSGIQTSARSESADKSVATSFVYAVGFRSGLLFSQGLLLGSALVGVGIRLQFMSRKRQMLIRYFDLVTSSQHCERQQR